MKSELKKVMIDMDDTLCDFTGAAWEALKKNPAIKFPQSQYGFFTNLKPIEGAISTFQLLNEYYDVWILTRPSYLNPLCYTEKRVWVENHLGIDACKKLILCPDKSLIKADYLIDDIEHKGFEGEWIKFERIPVDGRDWAGIKEYLL